MASIKSLTQPLSSALLLLSAGLLVYACEKQAAAPLQPSAPVSVQVVSGDLQSGPPGKELPNPLVVKVVDANGLPQSGQLVNFRVTSGGGSVFAGAALTSVSGIAQERWTLGTNPADSQRVEARAVDNVTGQALTFAVFKATITASVASVTVAPASASVGVSGTGVDHGPGDRRECRPGDGYGHQRRQDRVRRHHRERGGGVGDGDAGVSERGRRGNRAARGNTERRERECAVGAGRDVGQQRRGGGQREWKRARDGARGRVSDDHRDLGRQERQLGD